MLLPMLKEFKKFLLFFGPTEANFRDTFVSVSASIYHPVVDCF